MTEQRTVVVTGAAKGIGLACSKRFVEAGDRVVLFDVDEDAGRRSAAMLGEIGDARFAAVDVTSKARVVEALDDAFNLAKRLDVIVNSAGIVSGGSILDYTEEQFDKVIDINLKGTFLCAQAAAKHMVQQGYGAIINMSSVNGTVAIPDQVAYCASKGGINQMTRSMAVALAPHNVRVNALAPGTVLTDLARTVLSSEAAMRMVRARTPMGRGAEPSEVASVTFFLASPDASYITGEIIAVDGGRLALNYTMPVKE